MWISVFWCENHDFVFFGVKKSGISVFLVSVEIGAGVNKITNMTYGSFIMPEFTKSSNHPEMESGVWTPQYEF